MQQYIEPIQSAVFFFPLVAFMFTLPYVLYQYHRYGAILVLRTVVIYSFILYLICAYFLTILPLPDVEKVRSYTAPYYQLIPFKEFYDLFQNPNLVWSDPSTYKNFFLNRDFFQIAANILMTIPFGIYLRYYFKASLKKTLILSLALSLVFELTQLSGLFFLYPRPYRLADVDDLITNTLGGWMGYLIAPLFMKLLPSPERMNSVAYQRSTHVSILRRLCAAMVDCFLLLVVAFILFMSIPPIGPEGNSVAEKLLIVYGWYSVYVLMYFGVMEWLLGGRSPGKLLMHIRLVDTRTMKRPKLWQCVVRYGIFYLVVAPAPVMALVMLFLSAENAQYNVLAVILCVLLLFIFVAFCAGLIILSFMKGNRMPHGWFSKTMDVSTLRKKPNRKRRSSVRTPAARADAKAAQR